MLKMAKKTKAKLPNVAFGFGTKFHLTADEVMVYIHIQFAKQVGLMDSEVTRTTVDMLIDDLGWWTSKESRDRSKMVKILESLEAKGYITIESTSEKMSKGILTITIVAEMRETKAEASVKWKVNTFKFFGYTEIYGDDYNLAEKDGQKLIVVAYVLWRSGVKGYKIANKEWELVLDVTDKTAREIVNNTAVVKISGVKYKDENGQVKQEPNTYIPEKKVSAKSKMERVKQTATNMTYLEKFREKVTDIKYKHDDKVLMELNDSKTKLDWKGYKAWKETDCHILKEAGNKKFEILEKAGQTWIRKDLEDDYQERLENQQRTHRMMEIHMNDIEGYEEFQTSYKPKENIENNFFDECM